VFHQFIRVGNGAIAQGNSSFSQDLPPWCIGHGLNLIAALNIIGLKRAGYANHDRLEIKRAYALLRAPKGPLQAVLAASLATGSWSGPALDLLSFCASPGRKGVCAVVARNRSSEA
jgi:UDP-N-acetylglucosamine acyltransferase